MKLVLRLATAMMLAATPACAGAPSEKTAMTEPAPAPPRWPAPTEAQRAAAEAGDAAAMYALARHLGAKADVAPVHVTTPEGVALLKKAAAKGHPDAKAVLGWLQAFDEKADAKARAGGVKALEALAAQGVAEARYYLGWCLWEGVGTAKDDARAVKLYQQAADQQHAEAEYQVAIWYMNGTYVPQDADKARALFRRAHEHGNPEALEYGRQRMDAGPLEKLWMWMNAT